MQTHRNAGRRLSRIILPPGWRQTILDMYRNGASDKEVMIWIRQKRGTFSKFLWKRWLRDEPEFAETIELGRDLAQAWWMRLGREYVVNQPGGNRLNNSLYYWTMRNRFGWR